MDINGANANLQRSVLLQPLDSAGNPVEGINLSPETVRASLPVTLLGGYRNVVVKVITTGEPADGYWLTNMSLTPPNVTVFSTNPQLVNALPGYVETNPIVLTGLSDDVDVRATLDLPNGVTQVGEESVLVRLSIAAREGTLLINLPIEAIGLPPEMQAIFSPETVEVLLAGPLPILNNLKPAEIRVSVDLSGMEPGVYQVEPVVDLLPNQVDATYITPGTVQVTILPSPTPTPTGPTATPGTPSPMPAVTLTPTPNPTFTPTFTPTP
jgi:YbbR domain-containing protein